MRSIGKMVILVLLATTVPAGWALAGEANDNARRSAYLNTSSAMETAYLLARVDMDKVGGLRDRFDALTAQLAAWVDSWQAVADLIRNPPQGTLAEMDATFGGALTARSDALAMIAGQALDLDLALGGREKALRSLGKMGYSIELYELGAKGQARLEGNIGDLADGMLAMRRQLQTVLADFRAATQDLGTGLSAKVATIWAGRGVAKINDCLQTIHELFQAIDTLAPLQQDFMAKLGRYQSAYALLRLTTALDSLADVIARCASLEGDINDLLIADRYKGAAVTRYQALCAPNRQVYHLLSQNLASAMASAIAKRQARIANVCSSDHSETMNCKLYSGVAAISSAQIKAMKESTLRNLDTLFTAIEENKRRGQIFHGSDL